MEVKVSSIRKINKKPRCKITLENGVIFELSIDLVVRFQLCKNKIISNNLLSEIKDEQQLIDCKQAGYNYASYKPRSTKQVIDKLKRKGFHSRHIELSLIFLSDFDLIDDERFAMNFIGNTLRRKEVGKRKILLELMRKGISKEIRERAIDEYYPEDKSFELALRAAEKKMPGIKGKDIEKQKPAVINFLKGRGFDWTEIRSVIEEIFEKK